MPLSKAEKRAFEERKKRAPHRDIHHSTVAPMTRFGRKWLWDLTLNVPLQLLGDALEGAGPPLDATPQLQEKHRFDGPRMELVLARTCAALLGLEERRVRCEVLETTPQLRPLRNGEVPLLRSPGPLHFQAFLVATMHNCAKRLPQLFVWERF